MDGSNTQGAKDGTSALMILSPDATPVMAGGKEVVILPLKIGQLGKFSRAIKSVLPKIMEGMKPNGSVDIVGLLGDSSDDLIEAVAIGCSQPTEWVADLDTEDFIKLAGKLMVVNVDFFSQRIPSLLAAVERSINAVTQKTDGTKQSNA